MMMMTLLTVGCSIPEVKKCYWNKLVSCRIITSVKQAYCEIDSVSEFVSGGMVEVGTG